MANDRNAASTQTRRSMMKLAAGAAGGVFAAPMLAGAAHAQSAKKRNSPASRRTTRSGKPNILFVFTDQERYRTKWPTGLSLPGHERLQKTGTTFHNHYCPATMCTSSRSVMLTGLTTVDNGMFENCDMRYVGNLSTKIPTIGHLLRKLGYYTAYKGKWHLNREFDHNEEVLLTKQMEEYGFADYFSPGDIIGHTLGGYHFDELVAGSAVAWLRKNGRHLTDDHKPWAMFVSLVNPHDIMYFNTDLPGRPVQDTGYLMKHAAPAPNNAFYKAKWDDPIASSLREPLDAPGRPKAHGEFLKVWNYVLGYIPLEQDRWRRFNDFYINSIRAVDEQLNHILSELDALSLSDNTIIVFTSDHGEGGGAHGLHGKGPFAYEETMHLPMLMVHPDVGGGQTCSALTGHIDFVPTLMTMAGASADQIASFAGRELPGKNIGSIMSSPGSAGVNSLRESVLFTYSGLVTNDSEIYRINTEAKIAGKKTIVEMVKEGYRPDMKKRGSMRTAFDGRYKFSRYFSPVDRNSPKTIDELYSWNDVELFDLKNDPTEMKNLAVNRSQNGKVIMEMSEKLERVIRAEIGKDDGREMPNIPTVDWTINRVDL